MASARGGGVFDRPVVGDPLLWGGVGLGLALVLLSPPAFGTAWPAAVLDVLVRLGAGIAMAAVFGGFVRNLLRALGDEPSAGDAGGDGADASPEATGRGPERERGDTAGR